MQKSDISIIVVDDLHFSREVIRHTLLKAGFEDIRTAGTGNEAIIQLNQKPADLVIADFWMPGINGLELTRLIRQWDHSRQHYTGIILLTAEETEDAIQTAFEQEVDDFVSKSAPSAELAARAYGCGRVAVKFNQQFAMARSLGEMCMIRSNLACIDTETGLPNRHQLVKQLNNLRGQVVSRGGGFSVLMLQIVEEGRELSKITQRTIASSLHLVLRPQDLVSRTNKNQYVIVYHYDEAGSFNQAAINRVMESLFKHSDVFSSLEQANALFWSIWHFQQHVPSPSAEEILQMCESNLQTFDWNQTNLINPTMNVVSV